MLNVERIAGQGTLEELLLRSHDDVAEYEVAPASEQERLSMNNDHWMGVHGITLQ